MSIRKFIKVRYTRFKIRLKFKLFYIKNKYNRAIRAIKFTMMSIPEVCRSLMIKYAYKTYNKWCESSMSNDEKRLYLAGYPNGFCWDAVKFVKYKKLSERLELEGRLQTTVGNRE